LHALDIQAQVLQKFRVHALPALKTNHLIYVCFVRRAYWSF